MRNTIKNSTHIKGSLRFAENQKHDPTDEFPLKLIEESFTRASEVFLYSNTLTSADYSKGDLLHDVAICMQSVQRQEKKGKSR